MFHQMMGHDLLRPDVTRHGALCITENALPILREQNRIILREKSERKHKQSSQVRSLISEEAAPLLSALKSKRKALAEAARIPAYIVFNDKTLIDMAEQKPTTLEDMACINGVGAKKLPLYGLAFLSVITGGADRVHPNRRKLAGHSDGALYDQLLEAQASLVRGHFGTDKLMFCSASLLAKITRVKPRTLNDMASILGPQKAERFGKAFLDVLERLT